MIRLTYLLILLAAQGFASSPKPLEVPAAPESGMYSLVNGANGKIYLSWIETDRATKASTMKFSVLDRDKFSEPRVIGMSNDWFVNWADHPSIAALKDGTLLAHYLVNNPSKTGSYGYGIRLMRSTDDGKTWKEIFRAGEKELRDYAGFLSIVPQQAGFLAMYLTPGAAAPAGNTNPEEHHLKAVSIARFGPNGAVIGDSVVDPDACSCCNTSFVETADGPIAAYRDHQGEVRDISVVRFRGGKWTEPAVVNNDGWKINACPTNGPVLAANGRRVAVAWFTAANDVPRVRLAFSEDAGATFKTASAVDSGNPIGWPGVVLLNDGSAVVSWLENMKGGNGQVRIRRMWPSGKSGEAVPVAAGPAGRSIGVPQMVRDGNNLIIAWRADRVMAISVPVPAK